mgnify:CR=1 FL=1
MKKGTEKKSSGQRGATDWEGDQWQQPTATNDLHFGGYEVLLSCWQAIDGRIRLIISRDGRLLAASDGASRLFVQNDALARNGNFTLACTSSSDRQLRKLLDAKAGVVETVTLPKKSGAGHYVISAVGLSLAAVAIVIREADEDFVSVFADLEEAFGLTPCEVMVVVRLLRGYGAQRIAEDLDVSVHTVRSHLRHCYDKLAVSSREELWQRLAPYRLN